jgi:gamma-glutamyl-gamma-aminobutyrate hydrolase PuuD
LAFRAHSPAGERIRGVTGWRSRRDSNPRLADWNGGATAEVSSLHRHALMGEGAFRIAARAPDGVLEAIEGLGRRFRLGVQWHPEYRLTALDRRILAEFVQHCAARP